MFVKILHFILNIYVYELWTIRAHSVDRRVHVYSDIMAAKFNRRKIFINIKKIQNECELFKYCIIL